MELEHQVCSLDLAKRLKELGVKQLDNSLWAWAPVAQPEKDNLGRPIWKEQVVANDFQTDLEFVAAFTVAELGDILWDVFDRHGWKLLYKAYGEVFSFKGTERIGELGIVNLMRRPDMAAQMLVYLLENKLITV